MTDPVPTAPALRDPFAVAASVQFRAPGSSAATFVPADGGTIPCRVIRSTNPVDIIIGNRTINAGATLIQLQRSDFIDASPPASGDQVIIGLDTWKLIARPRLDVEGVSWTCEAAEA